MKEGAALMLVERTAYTDEGTPVEFARDLFRGDRTRLVMWTSELPARLRCRSRAPGAGCPTRHVMSVAVQSQVS